MLKFSRQTLALITGLTIVIVALFVLSFNSSPTQIKVSTVIPTPTPVARTVITLDPVPSLVTDGQGKVEVKIDTGGNTIFGVQFEIRYDPAVLTDISVTPGTFFTSPLPPLNSIDKVEGRISFAASIAASQMPLKGKGTIATIAFSKNPTTKETRTELEFLRNTFVVDKSIRPSVLKKATGTTIQLTSSALPQ
jgi:hypothetical protein